MKTIALLSILFLISPSLNTTSTNIEWFAQVLDEEVFLYKSPINEEKDNLYFMIEPTYFVKLLESANSTFYKAQYMDIVGYVKKREVQVVDSVPKNPFLTNIRFRVYLDYSQTMRSAPTTNGSDEICYLPYLCKEAIYYGKIYGESVVEERTKIWYYCSYSLDKNYYGYIYSDGCDQMTKINPNTEVVNYIDEPNFEMKTNNNNLSVITPTSNNYKIVIILISIPVAIFVFMLLRSNLILKSKKKEKAKEVKLFFDS
ncbi:MAG: hypothetical protein IJX26_00910 [Clostridia bacterium]|nr:hypothetical protein [Clostridia bacterium]